MKKFLGTLLFYLSFTFIALFFAVRIIQIPKINTKITQILLNAVLPKNMYAELSQIQGNFPFQIRVDTIQIYDQKGEWLVINKFEFSWLAIPLFGGEINIDRLGAEKVDFIRVPERLPDKSQRYNRFFFPLSIEKYFINQLKIFPLSSENLRIYGEASLSEEDQASLVLCFQAAHQLEQDAVDLLKLTVHKNGNKLTLFGEGKESLSSLQKGIPEFISPSNLGNYELSIDLEACLESAQIKGVCTGDIHPLRDIKFNPEPQLSWDINFKIDKSWQDFDEESFLSTLPFKAHWDLNYETVHNKDQILTPPYGEKLFLGIKGVWKGMNISVNAEGLLTHQHHGREVLTKILQNSPLHLQGDISYKNQGGNFYMNLIYSSLQTELYSDFRFRDAFVCFNNLNLQGIAHKVSGNFTFHQDTFLLHEMDCTLSIEDLRPFAKIFHQEGEGKLKGSLKKKKGQYDINFKIEDPSFQHLAFRALTSEISFQNLGNLTLNIKADKGFYKKTPLEFLRLKALLKEGKGQFEARLQGEKTQAFTKGSLVLDPNWKILLQNLQVFHKKELIVGLSNPVHMEIMPDHVKIASNKLKIYTGELLFSNLEFGKVFQGKISFMNLSPKIFSFLTDEFDLSGRIKGEFQFSDSQGQPQVSGDISLTDFMLIDSSRKIGKGVSLRTYMTYQDQKWVLKAHYQDSTSSKVDAQATILTSTFIPDGTAKISAKARGIINLSLLNPFIWGEDRLEGELKIALDFEKKFNHFQNRGTFTLSQGTYENAEFGTTLRGIDLTAELKESVLQVTKFSGTDLRKGTFSGRGTFQLEDFTAIQPHVFLKIDQMLVVNNDLISANVSGNIEIKPAGKKTVSVGGQITTHLLNIFLDDKVQKIQNIRILDIEKEPPLSSLGEAELTHEVRGISKYDLKIHIPEKLLIEGRGVKSLWKGDLHIRGEGKAPKIEGYLEIARGYVDILGKKMIITPYSQITFIHKNGEIDPFLNVKVKKNIRDVDVLIWFHGSATDSKIDFISIPVLSQEEIISLILFGKRLDGVSSAQSLQLATQFAALKAGGKKGNIVDKFQKAFQLDELSIGNNDSLENHGQQDIPSGYVLKVGKQLNDKVYFGINQRLGGTQSDTKALIDIDITKETKVNLEAGPKGGTIGYFWEKRY